MATTAAIVGVGTAIAGTSYTAVNANQQRIAGERAASAQQAQIADKEKQAQAQDQATQQQQAQLMLAQKQRAQMAATTGQGTSGLQSTILTSPLGVPNQGQAGQGGKTLLGG